MRMELDKPWIFSFYPLVGLLVLCSFFSCENKTLQTVTVSEFSKFVEETGYITDAEQYGWSVVQITVDSFQVVKKVNWMFPDSLHQAGPSLPVTQVSYKDALAYANWSGTRLPSYEEYWAFVKNDQRLIHKSSNTILPVDQVNIIGNTWDITLPDPRGQIRLAGGSYLCNENTCNGTDPNRELYVDQETGNTHISFSVIRERREK